MSECCFVAASICVYSCTSRVHFSHSKGEVWFSACISGTSVRFACGAPAANNKALLCFNERRLGSYRGLSKGSEERESELCLRGTEGERCSWRASMSQCCYCYCKSCPLLRLSMSLQAWPDPRQFQRADFPSLEQRAQSRWLLRGLPVYVDGPYRAAALSKQQLQALVRVYSCVISF